MSTESIDEVWSLKLFGDGGELGHIYSREHTLRAAIADWQAKRMTEEVITIVGFTDTADRAKHEIIISASIIRAMSLIRMY